MKVRELGVGDVIELKDGMAVHFENFENIFYDAGNLKGSGTGLCHIGKIYEARGDGWESRVRLRNGINDLFKFEDRKLDQDILLRFLKHQVRDSEPRTFCIPPGLYRVSEVISDTLRHTVYCQTHQTSKAQQTFKVYFFQRYNGSVNHNDIMPVDI